MFCGNSDEEMVRMYNTLLKMTTRVIFQILITCVVCCMLWYILYVLRVEKVPGNERKKNNHDDDEENNNKNERWSHFFLQNE